MVIMTSSAPRGAMETAGGHPKLACATVTGTKTFCFNVEIRRASLLPRRSLRLFRLLEPVGGPPPPPDPQDSVREGETGQENTLCGYKRDSKDQNKSSGTLCQVSSPLWRSHRASPRSGHLFSKGGKVVKEGHHNQQLQGLFSVQYIFFRRCRCQSAR